MKIKIDVFDPHSIDAAIKKLEDYSKDLDRKAEMLCERLAQIGVMYAEWNFSSVDWMYSGDVDYAIDAVRISENKYAVTVNGEGVLFIEFGAGSTLGYGHPTPVLGETQMGPGTYPNGKGHWNSPNGWWYVNGDGTKVHTYGNAPGMPMYNAAKYLRQEIAKTAREVFRS